MYLQQWNSFIQSLGQPEIFDVFFLRKTKTKKLKFVIAKAES